jgi:transposase InsO family protein
VITDHKPLEAIFNKPLIQPPARIERWLLKLQLYDFTVIYQPGKSNPADYMSRHPIPSTAVSTREQSIAENYVNSICMKSVPKPVPLGSITSATKEDKAIQLIFKILNQKRCKKEEVEKLNSQEKDWFISLKQIQLQLTRIETEEGEMLLKDTRIVIPHSLTEKIIDIAHQGHQGIVKTKALLREKVWFPGIDKAVERKVTNCIPCQACSKKNSPEPLQMSSLPAEPWTEVSIDFADMPMGEHLLVVYDDYSRYPVVTKVSSTSAKVVTKKLEDIFAQFGIPEVVKSDNGPPFQSYDFKQFAQDLNFKHRRVTPLWPQANGGVERFMKTLKKALRCAVAEKRNWREEIPRFLLNYRNSPHASTGKAPATLLFGRSLRTRLPQIPKIKKEEEIRNKDLKSKSRMKENADKKAKHRELKEGDFVLLRRDKLANKLQAPFDPSPYRITEVKKSMITAERNNKKVTRNVTFFKKIERKDEESEESEESEDEYYHKALENVNFPEQIQVPVHDDPQQNEPVEEPENANDAPPAGVQLPVEGTQAYDGDTVQRAISVARARLLEALVRNPPPNELVRPTRVQSEPTSPEESTRPKRNRQPPKRLDDFVVNMFHSKKGK